MFREFLQYIQYVKSDPWAWFSLVFMLIFVSIAIFALVQWISGN